MDRELAWFLKYKRQKSEMQNFQPPKLYIFYSQAYAEQVNFLHIYKFIYTKDKKDLRTKHPIYKPNVQLKEYLEVLPSWNETSNGGADGGAFCQF